MDLWIRSQDRKELIPVKAKLRVNEGDFIRTDIDKYEFRECYSIFHDTDFLGEYKTKERAYEVFDEIQQYLKDIAINNTTFAIDSQGNITFTYPIYIMPEE